METKYLNEALDKLRSDHRTLVLVEQGDNGAFGCRHIITDRHILGGEQSIYNIPGNLFTVTHYYIKQYEKYPNCVHVGLRCARKTGTIHTIRGEFSLDDLTPVYIVGFGASNEFIRLELQDPKGEKDDPDADSFRELPEPNDENIYVVTPLGGQTKSCRK